MNGSLSRGGADANELFIWSRRRGFVSTSAVKRAAGRGLIRTVSRGRCDVPVVDDLRWAIGV